MIIYSIKIGFHRWKTVYNYNKSIGNFNYEPTYGFIFEIQISDINIPYFVPQEKRGHRNITTQIPVIYILETLARTIYSNSF